MYRMPYNMHTLILADFYSPLIRSLSITVNLNLLPLKTLQPLIKKIKYQNYKQLTLYCYLLLQTTKPDSTVEKDSGKKVKVDDTPGKKESELKRKGSVESKGKLL